MTIIFLKGFGIHFNKVHLEVVLSSLADQVSKQAWQSSERFLSNPPWHAFLKATVWSKSTDSDSHFQVRRQQLTEMYSLSHTSALSPRMTEAEWHTCWLYVNLFKTVSSDHNSVRYSGEKSRSVMLHSRTQQLLPPPTPIRQGAWYSSLWASWWYGGHTRVLMQKVHSSRSSTLCQTTLEL